MAPAERLTELLARNAANLPVGGIVLTTIEGETTRHHSFGQPHPDPALAPEHIVFEIGSITKAFTGLLLAQTVLEGRVQLDDPIGPLLPAELDLAPEVAAITLRELATHTSGLPRLPGNFDPANPFDPYADYDLDRLHAFLRQHRPARAGPYSTTYSNLGSGLLGHLLERIHGQSYDDLIASKITGPLGLNDTVITLSSDQTRRFAPPHSGRVAVSPWTFAALPGLGGLRSTTADLARFARAMLDPVGPLAAARALAGDPQSPFGVGGGTGGFRCFLEIEPALNRATVIWLNNDTFEPATLLEVARRPTPEPDTPVRESTPEMPPAPDLAGYEGTFRLEGGPLFTVAVHPRGDLMIRLTGQGFLPVAPRGEDRFAHASVGAEFHFARAPDDTVESLTLHQRGQVLPAHRVASERPVIFPAAAELTAYAGAYQLGPGMLFEVSAHGEQLVVKLTGQPAFPVFPSGPDQFYYDVVEAALTFERDAEGRVVALVLHQNNQNARAPRVAD
jgi:serine-type D-Ala-D-Ala carboxypeptidase/endopeptidase